MVRGHAMLAGSVRIGYQSVADAASSGIVERYVITHRGRRFGFNGSTAGLSADWLEGKGA